MVANKQKKNYTPSVNINEFTVHTNIPLCAFFYIISVRVGLHVTVSLLDVFDISVMRLQFPIHC